MGPVPSDGVCPKVRDDGLVVERVEGELLVYDRERDRAHCLNETAALVFEQCDGTRSVAELAAQLSAETGESIDEDVVARALVTLSAEHLLEEPFLLPTTRPAWSRRQVLHKVGVASAAASLGLPVVKSIVAPTPAHAQSPNCLTAGATCGTLVFPLPPPNPPACQPGVFPCCPGLTCSNACTCQ